MKALCILTRLLGNQAAALRLVEVLDKIGGLDRRDVHIMAADYARYPVPAWARLSSPWETQRIAVQKVAEEARGWEPQILIVHSWENAVAFAPLARRMPAAVLMDAVPSTVNFQMTSRGYGGWKRKASHWVHDRNFRKAIGAYRYCLPMGSDCERALVEDYGFPRENCRVTLAPQKMWEWRRVERSYGGRPLRLLFVGNDFERKGGDFLLKLYGEHLAGWCELTIASNDPVWRDRTMPEGVHWLKGKGREELIETYLNHDVFVLPTRQDYMPQVLGEALAAGMPCLASDVGGIVDLVRNGETGYLMARGAAAGEWASRLRQLADHPEQLEKMSRQARQFAEEKLSFERFEGLIADVVERLKHNR